MILLSYESAEVCVEIIHNIQPGIGMEDLSEMNEGSNVN
jgi:hypothetical protein